MVLFTQERKTWLNIVIKLNHPLISFQYEKLVIHARFELIGYEALGVIPIASCHSSISVLVVRNILGYFIDVI